MNTYKVYQHPTLGYEAVKVGFSWPALFLGLIWMSAKRLWGLAALWFLMYIALVIIEASTYDISNQTAQTILLLALVGAYVGLSLLPGIKGNAWHATSLARRGYQMINEVQANTQEEALRVTRSPAP
jgi:hypothetical protein